MKILQVHARYREAGGEDGVARAEADLLRRAGHEVVRLSPQNPSKVIPTVTRLAAAPWNRAAASHARRLVERYAPDVVHVHNTWYALSPAVLPAMRKAGVPIVMTLHNFRLMCANGLLYRDGHPCQDCVGTHPWHGVQHRCYRDSTLASTAAAATIAIHQTLRTWHRDVDVFLALTGFARDRFIAGGLPADKISIKPNFTGDPGPRPSSPADSDVVLFVGRLSPEKGVLELMRAWNEAAPAGLRLLIVGDGPERRRVAALAGANTTVLGFREPAEVQRLMLEARALVFPSRWYEMFALTIVEAMAAGLPIAASEVGGLPEVVGDAAPSLVPWDDHAGWVSALRRLTVDADLEDAGKRARERYEAYFSEAAAITRLEAAYLQARGMHGQSEA